MKKIDKVLALVSPNSGNSNVAAARAVRVCRAFGAQLHLSSVVSNAEFDVGFFHLETDSVEPELIEDAERLLSGLAEVVDLERDRITTSVEVDHPFDHGALAAVKSVQPDLVVMTPSRAHDRRLTRAEWRLIHGCQCPVLLARSDTWPASPSIAACVDPHHPDDAEHVVDRAIIDWTLLLNAKLGKTELVHAMHQIPTIVEVAEPAEKYQQDLEASRRQSILDLMPEDARNQVPIRLVADEPIQGVERYCHDRSVDLAVIGIFARSRLHDLMVGSLARGLLPRLDCDVLAIPAA